MKIPLPSSAMTETRNAASQEIDTLTARQIVDLMNSEDAKVTEAVAQEADHIAAAIDLVADRLRNGGRLIYMGAGTSGRLGVLDASECPPTFSVPRGMIVGLIAGGQAALTTAIEGAEDRMDQGVTDLKSINANANDVIMGIATSGRTPYVIGGLNYARELGAATMGFACNQHSPMVPLCDIMIAPIVGPEVITGSTRLKSGTATKLVLNMITTGAMVQIGKTYGNLMVDLTATNEKLRDRSRRIVSELTGLSAEESQKFLEECAGEVKTAVVSSIGNVSPQQARLQLEKANGQLRLAIKGIANQSLTE